MRSVPVIVIAVSALASPAIADPFEGGREPGRVESKNDPPVRQWNVAAPIHGLAGGGLVVEAERQVWPRWSLGGFAGLQSSAAGDYSSIAASGGVEVRWWLLGWTVKSPLRESIVGGYLGAGLELSTEWLHDEIDDRGVGSTTSVAAVASVGYRFAPWSRVSITPSAHLAIGRDVAGDIPDRFTVRPRYGVTIGVLF